MMSKYRFAILWGILIVSLASFILLSAGQNNDFKINEEEYPVICVTCAYACSVWFDSTQIVAPGHQAIVSVKAKSERSIGRINIKATPQAGLKYVGLNTTGTTWKGGFKNDSDSILIDVQCTTAVMSETLSRGSDWNFLFNLTFDLDDTVNFSNTKTIVKFSTQYPEFGETPAASVCTGKQRNSKVRTLTPNWKIWADTILANSYQCLDSINDPAKYVPDTVVIKYWCNYPVDSLKVRLNLTSMGPVTSKITNSNYYVRLNPSPATYPLIYAFDSDTTSFGTLPYSADSANYTWLCKYAFKGKDYGSSYATNSFQTTDPVSFIQTNFFLHCDSSKKAPGWDASKTGNGGLFYPVYACTAKVTSAYMPWSKNVTVPVKADHSFWSQYYIYYLDYDSTCLKLQSVTTPAGSTVQGVALSYDDTTGNKITIQLESDAAVGKFIQPQTNATMFNLNFTASDSFMYTGGDTTWIRFRTTDRTNSVKDFFHANASKIVRDNSDGTTYFNLSPGYVRVYPHFDVALSTVEAKSDTVPVPLNLTRVESNSYDIIDFYIEMTGNAVFATDATGPFDVSKGDYSFSSVQTSVYNSGKSLHVVCQASTAVFDDEGLIGEVRCIDQARRPGETAILDFTSFECSSQSGLNLVEASKEIDGLIYLGSPKLYPNGSTLPQIYSLAQNYPNPFNLKTIIAYTIPQAGDVKLEVFDILGRHVKTGVNSYLEAGEHQYIWDGTNDAGATVGTGFYIYNLRSGEFKQTKKMLLLK
jgi:hypothetical protein